MPVAGTLLKGRLTKSSATSLALLCCAAALVELTDGNITSHFDFFVVRYDYHVPRIYDTPD